jgi:2',3'-cyclic-nucleotide 2'-phosphodiesterase (5'-nucleotidase family)
VRLTILHTNDIHGRQERIAQIATLVRREKAAADHPVLHLDAGDVEETTNRLSNLTKGTAMHRLLSQTTCDAATVGNACWLRYGPAILAAHARASSYPQLLANFAGVDGPVPSVLLDRVGVFGLTAPFAQTGDGIDWGFERLEILETARSVAGKLRAEGAELVVLLSHLGLESPLDPWDDSRLVPELQGEVDLVIGAHTHHLLPEGEWIGRVLVAQAGEYGNHIGRVEIDGDSMVASVEAIPDDLEQWAGVGAEAARIEQEVEAMLADDLGSVDVPLDAQYIAEVMRRRMDAEVGLYAVGQVIAVLAPGRVTRGALWEASDSAANPGVTRIGGARLLEMLRRGNDPAFAAETPRPLRGRPRGRLEIVGIDPTRIDAEREYVVAGTDWELEQYGGYVDADWNLAVRYEFPTIVREAVEEHLGAPPPR